MPSQALLALADRLSEVRLLTTRDPIRQKPLVRDRARQRERVRLANAVNRASIVLLTSHLEGFIEDLMLESLDYLVNSGCQVEALPDLLRSLHAEQHLKVIEAIQDRKARAPRIAKMIQTEQYLWRDGEVLAAPMLRGELVVAEMSNPGSREIARFLELIGVADLESACASQQADLGAINGLVQRRNSVAHGEPEATCTATDIDTYLRLVEQIGAVIDAAVAHSIKSMTGSTSFPWAL